jgi:hypothetical protein
VSNQTKQHSIKRNNTPQPPYLDSLVLQVQRLRQSASEARAEASRLRGELQASSEAADASRLAAAAAEARQRDAEEEAVLCRGVVVAATQDAAQAAAAAAAGRVEVEAKLAAVTAELQEVRHKAWREQ